MDLKTEVYTPGLELVGMLEIYNSVLWEEKAFTAGTFSISSLITDESRNLLVKENIIWIEGGTAGIIEHIDQKAGDDGPYITIKGRTLTSVLDRRILWGLYDLSGTVPDIMRHLVEDCCINPTRGDIEARKIPGLVLTEQSSADWWPSVRVQKTGGSLLDFLENLGKTYAVAFGVRFNPQLRRMEFWTRPGVDRSIHQTVIKPVFYSTELDDVLRSEYTYDSHDFRNVALVAGEGEGSERTMITVSEETESELVTPPDTPEPPVTVKYTVSLSVSPDGGGTATGGGSIEAGQSVTVTASAYDGYEFTGWEENGSIVSANASYTFAVSANRSLTAVFTAIARTYAISTTVDPSGSGVVSGAGIYQEGQPVSITAVPEDGYKFVSWQENGQTVSESENYTFTVSGNRDLVAVFEAVALSGLPDGYTQVEYIESGGSQYIKTGVKPTSATKIVMDVEPTAAGSSSGKYFFDSHYFVTSGNKYVLRAIWGNSGVKASMGVYSAITDTVLSSNTAMRRIALEIDAVSKTASVDGVTKNFSSNSMINSMSDICLLNYNTGSTYALAAKLYSCKIYNGDDLLRDFVPCKNPSGDAGLYDVIEGVFYAGSSTGTFIAGPAV